MAWQIQCKQHFLKQLYTLNNQLESEEETLTWHEDEQMYCWDCMKVRGAMFCCWCMRVVWCSVRVVERGSVRVESCWGSVIQVVEGVRVVWGCVRVFYYYSNILCILKIDVWDFSLLLLRQTLHIQNRHKDGHDQSPKNKTRIWPMHTQNSAGQIFSACPKQTKNMDMTKTCQGAVGRFKNRVSETRFYF